MAPRKADATSLTIALEEAGEGAPEGAIARFEAQDQAGEWIASGHLGVNGGRLAVVELTIRAGGRARTQEVTSTLLRKVKPSWFVEAAAMNRMVVRHWQVARPGEAPEFLDWVPPEDVDTGKIRPQGGRPPLGDDHFRRLAERYLELQAQHGSHGLLVRLAKEEGRPRDTIRDWVHQARVRGYLTPGTPGRGGAGPGPRLLTDEDTP